LRIWRKERKVRLESTKNADLKSKWVPTGEENDGGMWSMTLGVEKWFGTVIQGNGIAFSFHSRNTHYPFLLLHMHPTRADRGE
jgi:hypothetical protein